MNRRIAVASSVLGIVVAGLALAETAHALRGDPSSVVRSVVGQTVSTIQWGPCNTTEIPQRSPAVCATLSVPLDYGNPDGVHIQLALAMVRHTSSAALYQGVILVNPGGPGAPGLALSGLGQRVPGGVGADYDWIGFDPRGVGDSVPALRCDPTYFRGPQASYVPASRAATSKWLERAAAYSTACVASGGALLDHDTTVDSARDLDSIRKALGQAKISYYGYSYGTYLGQVYATLYPTHLKRLVLDSNVDPRTVWYQANLAQDTAFESTMNAWFSWLASHDAAYHLGSTRAAVRAQFYARQAALQAHPVDGELGGDEWHDLFLRAGYSQHSWVSLGQAFSQWVRLHDPSLILDAYRSSSADNAASYPGYLAVECTDTTWPKSAAQNLADSRRTFVKARYLTWQNQWFNAPCLTWRGATHPPIAIDGTAVRDALLIDQTGDAATPYEGSLEVRKLFPHAALLAVPGGTTHADSLHGYPCVDNVVATYLRDGSLPPRKPGSKADASCPAPPLPTPS